MRARRLKIFRLPKSCTAKLIEFDLWRLCIEVCNKSGTKYIVYLSEEVEKNFSELLIKKYERGLLDAYKSVATVSQKNLEAIIKKAEDSDLNDKLTEVFPVFGATSVKS